MNKLLLLRFNPYRFGSLMRQSDGNFSCKIDYNSYELYKFDFPQNIRFDINDKNKMHINLTSINNLRLSNPVINIFLEWDVLLDDQKKVLLMLLNSQRLGAEISFDSGKNYIKGEIIPKIKTRNLTGYLNKHLEKTTLIFITKLTNDILPKLF